MKYTELVDEIKARRSELKTLESQFESISFDMGYAGELTCQWKEHGLQIGPLEDYPLTVEKAVLLARWILESAGLKVNMDVAGEPDRT